MGRFAECRRQHPMRSPGAAPRGFKIAGDDGNFVDANVTLVGNTIVVDTSGVTGTPKVRYAWEDSPALDSEGRYSTLNLVNSEGLPMAPFRTDRDRYILKPLIPIPLRCPIR